MGRKVNTITLTEEQRSYLELQTRARTIQAQTVCRARILLLRADGVSINDIADKVGINRCSVMLCLNKFKEGGVENALFDAPGRGRNAEITDDEKTWIINIACQCVYGVYFIFSDSQSFLLTLNLIGGSLTCCSKPFSMCISLGRGGLS